MAMRRCCEASVYVSAGRSTTPAIAVPNKSKRSKDYAFSCDVKSVPGVASVGFLRESDRDHAVHSTRPPVVAAAPSQLGGVWRT